MDGIQTTNQCILGESLPPNVVPGLFLLFNFNFYLYFYTNTILYTIFNFNFVFFCFYLFLPYNFFVYIMTSNFGFDGISECANE